MKTTILTMIEGDKFVATCPHLPTARAEHANEAMAVNDLIAQIRQHTGGGGPVEWIEAPKVKPDKNVITRKLTGLWPESIRPVPATDKNKEQHDGN